jgi:hypothetical protein
MVIEHTIAISQSYDPCLKLSLCARLSLVTNTSKRDDGLKVRESHDTETGPRLVANDYGCLATPQL